MCKDLWGSNPNNFHTVSQSLPTPRKSLTPTGLLIQQDLWENSCIVHSSLALKFYMSCNHHTNHCKMKKYFALYIRIVWKYVFMVYRLEFHCLLLVMVQSQMFEVEHKRLMTFLCVTQLQPSSESLTANQCEG